MRMSAKPSVSFIVIAFNERAGIERTLQSIASQATDLEFEIILVDDGSTDLTFEFAGCLMAEDRRYRAIRHSTNLGRGQARRTGISASQSALLAFIDADIQIPPGWLQRCVDTLLHADAVSGIAVPDGDAAVVARITGALPRATPGSQELTGNNLLFSRKILDTIDFPGTDLGEDFRFTMLLKKNGFRVARVNGLEVAHFENKTFASGIKWMIASGIDANRLLLEFKQIRIPDIAFAVTSISILISVAYGFAQPLIFLLPIIMLLGISFCFNVQRFSFKRRKLRWLWANTVSTLFVSAYLLSRLLSALTALANHYAQSTGRWDRVDKH